MRILRILGFALSILGIVCSLGAMLVPVEFAYGETLHEALVRGSKISGKGLWWSYGIFPTTLSAAIILFAMMASPRSFFGKYAENILIPPR